MLLISASVKPSPIHGMGCFTNEKIKKGQTIWVLDKRIDVSVPCAELPSLPEPIQAFLHMYGYAMMEDGEKVIVLCGDHSKHMNHSDEPNVIEAEGGANIAARDIEAGEELTCNYHSFDLDVAHKFSQ